MKRKMISLMLVACLLTLAGCGSESNTLTNKWIDSDIKGFVTADTVVSEKDDFAAAVNKDLILSGELEGSNLGNIQRIIAEKKRALIKDTSYTSKNINEVRKFVDLAENWDKRNSLGVAPLAPYIETIEKISSVDDLYDFIVDPQKNPLGVAPIVAVTGRRSGVEPSSNFVYIGKVSFLLGTAKNYFNLNSINLEKMVDFEEQANLILSQMGYDRKQVKTILNDAYMMEKMLVGAMKDIDSKEEEDITFTKAEIGYIEGKYPLLTYLESRGYGKCGRFITDSEYIKSLDMLCRLNFKRMKNLFIVEYLSGSWRYLDKETIDKFIEIGTPKGVELGIDDRTDQEKEDDMLFDEYIGKSVLVGAMDEAYIDRYFDEDVTGRFYKLCDDLLDSIGDMFDEEEWLSEEGKRACHEKLDAISVHVIYPDDVDYSDLYITPYEEGGNFLEARYELVKYGALKDGEWLSQDFDRDKWNPYNPTYSTTQANAFYDLLTNGIYILAGILEDPVYYEGMTDEELLAGLGEIVGHEITHGFDANGVYYDKDGIENECLPEEDRRAFDDRTTKVTLFYSSLMPFVGSGSYNGNNVKAEATADMGGMKACLVMAKKRDDFDYDKFFRYNAKIWAEQIPKDYEKQYMGDVHPLSYLRINVTLSQFDEFNETYGVSEGDGMYVAPGKRIAVW